jgi:kumamolisin
MPARNEEGVTIGMTSRDPLGLKAFSSAVTTPGTPQYGHFLSVRQFAQRFGAGDVALARTSATPPI